MHTINSTDKKRFRHSPLHILLGVAILASLVTPLAFAGASSPTATSAKVTDAKLKGLKKRVAALEAKTSTPSGPAGGDLQGQYPNPQLKANSVTSAEIAPDAVGQDDLGPQAVGFNEIGLDAVGSLALAGDSVGSSELKGVIARVGAGVGSNNTFVNASVTCQPGEMVIGGGYAWTADTAVDMVASAPDDPTTGNPNTTWVVRGRSTGANTLFAWANCLQV
jgi:hypothetical protein